jgi:hypothetical protein
MIQELLTIGLPGNGPSLTPLERGLIAHLIADWLLQNNWMAKNKSSLAHPAAWVHGGVHAGCLTLALGWSAGLGLGLLHMLTDTRRPVGWWLRSFKRSTEEPDADQTALWVDQVIHIVCIAAWISWVPL